MPSPILHKCIVLIIHCASRHFLSLRAPSRFYGSPVAQKKLYRIIPSVTLLVIVPSVFFSVEKFLFESTPNHRGWCRVARCRRSVQLSPVVRRSWSTTRCTLLCGISLFVRRGRIEADVRVGPIMIMMMRRRGDIGLGR